jgi:cyclase
LLSPRIIPCLLIQDGGLVKTVEFKNPKYLGDPINAVRIFNEKQIDELIVLDIDATVKRKDPDFKMISNLASECRMPLCYGGGINNSDQIRRIIELGVEKVSLSSAAIQNPDIIDEGAKYVGSQSIVITLDIKNTNNGYMIFTENGRNNTGRDPVSLVKEYQMYGVGEIVINSILFDGTMNGYHFDLIDLIKDEIGVPLTVMGGAGSHNDIEILFSKYGLIGAGAGSLFVFKGPYKAVLINYPNEEEKEKILLNYYKTQANQQI